MEGNLIFELADELKALRDRKAELEAELKQINRKIYFVDADLSDLMGTTGTQNFTRDGTMFFLTTKVHASARAGMKEALPWVNSSSRVRTAVFTRCPLLRTVQ